MRKAVFERVIILVISFIISFLSMLLIENEFTNKIISIYIMVSIGIYVVIEIAIIFKEMNEII